MKLVISKSKDGKGYYSKIQNDYNGTHTEKYLTLQMPKDKDFEYGLYEVDGFLSTYQKKDETVELKMIITSANLINSYDNKEEKVEKNSDDPFKEFGEQLEISDDALPF